jgi:hypothetical protein
VVGAGGIVRSRVFLLAGVLLLGGCASEEPTTYGPTVAGPTKTSAPSPAPSVPEMTVAEEPIIRKTGAALCAMFSTAEISELLGLPVKKVVVSKRGPYSVCTWKAVEGEGIASITRGDGNLYTAYEKEIVAEANRKKARGRKDLEGVGQVAFAIGASVSGVPNWYAAVLQDGYVTGIQLAGAGSTASIATAKGFMIEILTRG